jgi:hypothetical protein
MFEGSDCVQIGPDGTADQRPLAWAKAQASKGQAKAASRMPTTYFDLPTTLFTSEAVITTYLGQQATPEEQKALFKNQANAFASFIEQQPSALTDHVKIIRRPSMGDVAKYLRK